MASKTAKIIQWKKLYQLVSGTFYNESQEAVKKALLDVTTEIEEGLAVYKKPSAKDSEKVEKLLKEKRQERLIPFTQKLFQFLDLDANQTYEILCYYLVHEYRGSAGSLQNFVSSESLMIKLLSDIWIYYSLERTVLLKVTKCIIEYQDSPDHPYQEAFKSVVDKIGFEKLRKSYINQFEALVQDVQQMKFSTGDIFNSPQKLQQWSERKHREINDILQIILLTCSHDPIHPEELQKLVELFKLHSFGKQNQFLSATNAFHSDLVQKVTYSEIALLSVAFSFTNVKSLAWMKEIIAKLDDTLIAMHHYPEHGPILLSWMLFKFASKSNEATTDHYAPFGKLGSRAVQLNVFDFLQKMLSHKMFSDKSKTAKTVTRCIYENLSFTCELFNSDGSIAQHPKVFELLAEILKSPAIAKEFCKSDTDPIRTLFECATLKFPFDFVPLSMIAHSLATASKASHNWIVKKVQQLEVYTEQPTDPMYELRKVYDDDDEDACVLLNDYRPLEKIDFLIKAGTQATAREDKNKMFVHFHVPVNYFQILHSEINLMLNSLMNYSEIKESRVKRLEAGIRFLSAVIAKNDGPEDITNEMIHPTELVFDILSKFKGLQSPPLDLLAVCVDVCTELVGSFGDEIYRRFANLQIAPSVNAVHRDFKAYANGVGFESGLVGYYLINVERVSGHFKFLKSYLNFLKKFSLLEVNHVYEIELPGLIFLLREILVHADSWQYENEKDKLDIFIFVFEYLYGILTIPSAVLKEDPSRMMLRNVCLYSLLNLEQSVALLKFVSVGNPALLSNFVENETNWFFAADSNLNFLVLSAMRILMQILKFKDAIADNVEHLTPLEQLIYTQPKQRDTLKIIPIVTSYTSYPFNRRYAVLSCRLLRRFAIEFQSSLSACLDMEPDQLRMMFLQRLRDDLESDDLKVAVLDLVNSCIGKQPGLTEAFFKVTYEQDQRNKFFIKRSKESESMCDGILTYMEEYLEAIATDPTKTTHEQLKKIMNLFHALWKQGLQSLVKDLMKKDSFWPSLCSPILASPNIASYQYSQLFNILGIELFKIRESSDESENFKKVLVKFLSKDAFKRWLEIVFGLPTMDFEDSTITEDTPEWLSRMQSFKDFLVILLRKKSFVEMPIDSNKVLMDMCLQTLIESSSEIENGADTRPFILLTELFLILLNDQKTKYTIDADEDRLLLKDIETLLKTTTNCYNDLHKRAKDSVLAIAIKAVELEADEIAKNSAIASSFVRYNVEMLCIEFSSLESQLKLEENESGNNFTIILAVNLLKRLIMIEDIESTSWHFWFNHYKIFNRLMSVINAISQLYHKRTITAELLELLVLFAKGPFSKELLHCDLSDYLWMKLTPPKELIEQNFNDKPSKNVWTAQDWWIIYAKGIQLVKLLLEQHSHLFVKEALFFVGIHEEFLIDCIMLAKTSLEPNAMKLIKITLELLSEVVKYENTWRIDYFDSVMSIMRCIQGLLETTVSLLHRPKILKRLTEASKTQLEEYSDAILTDPSDDLINSMNELIEVVTLCSRCLSVFSPQLLNLLCDVEFNEVKWTPFIEVQFGAPKINPDFQQLSFGTVLSAIGFLVKALNVQHHTFKQAPLNSLPTEDAADGNETVAMSTFSESTHQHALGQSSSPLSPRRPFSKSLSMNSVSSSVVQASNELLSHLESKICVAALEFMLSLLASQSLLALKNRALSSRDKQLIRRELSNELYCFHDFVKKKILRDSSKSVFCRQKLGAFSIVNQSDDDDDSQPGSSRLANQRRNQDLRVNVVRKLHLQHKSSFEIPTHFSPIQQPSSSRHVPIDSTPLRSTGEPQSSTIKRVNFDLTPSAEKILLQEDDEPYAVNPGDPSFTGLSFVKLVEEDYLHLLSNLFMFICQSEN